MSIGGIRFMWLFVFFDLPTGTKSQRRTASNFRKFLVKDGYCMIQFSVYGRICNGQDGVDKHLVRLKNNLPSTVHVRSMQITDLQYSKMQIHVGKKLPQEKQEKAIQLSFF